MDVCISSLLPEGKKILIINNGTYSMRAVEICEYYNLPFINFKCPIDELPDLDKVEQIIKGNRDIALVYTTHNETGTGILNPVREIGSLAHKFQIWKSDSNGSEDKIAELEGGIGAMCTTSGQAAVLLSLLNICNAGDSFISTTEIYGGSVNLFSHTLRRLGIECIYIDKNATDEEIGAAFQVNTKAVFGETIANPALTVFDIERFAMIAHEHGVPLIIDNTFATPILCKPFEFGADIIIHSTSKYMDGHAVQVGGAIVDSGNFDWTNGKFPDLTEPDESYHGISYTETYGKKAYIVKARMQLMRDFGVYPAAHSAFLLNLGLETLAVRMKQYCENAMTVAKYLEQSDKVEKVNYPGLESDESYGLARKYLSGCSGVISFVIKGGKEAAVKFMNERCGIYRGGIGSGGVINANLL